MPVENRSGINGSPCSPPLSGVVPNCQTTDIRPKKSNIPKRRESDGKNSVAVTGNVSQFCCVSQNSDALDSQGTKKFRRNMMQKVLEPVQTVRLTKSTLRHALLAGGYLCSLSVSSFA